MGMFQVYMVMNRSLIPALFAFRPGFEAFVQPKVLCRLLTDTGFDEIIHALGIGDGVCAWEVLPFRHKSVSNVPSSKRVGMAGMILAPVICAMRDKPVMVAVGIPKKFTNTESLRPKSCRANTKRAHLGACASCG